MKRLQKKTTLAIIAALCFTFIFSLFYSCEIGLGSAVDVQPPSLTINSPTVDSVIRGKFALKGTWNDDGTISGITVELKRTDDNAKPVKISGVFFREEKEVDGQWKIIVDPVENNLLDGTYQATVIIKDKSDHQTTQSTTFTIDNTPPVLILKKPSSAFVDANQDESEISTVSVFGKTLYLEGSIADLTKETWIQIDFYSDKECTEANKLYTIETDSIAPTDVNQNNTRYATYEEEPETQNLVKNAYYYIYKKNEIKNGSEEIYAKLTVYDTAELLPVEEETETEGTQNTQVTEKGHIRGNSTQEFYISSELAKDLTKSVGMGGKGYAPIDLYKILNGSEDLMDSNRSANTEQTKKAELEETLKEKAKTISVFSINPDNNPYFTVSGLKTLTESGTDFASADNGYYIKNGALTLEISVFMGSDSFEIDTKDPEFYAYLIECDENAEPIKPDVDANRIKLYSKYKETGSGKDKKQLFKIGGNEESKTNTGVYIFSVPINKTVNTNTEEGAVELTGLVYGHNYLIRVNGKDVEGNVIDNETNKYGFRFTSSGAAPEITITEPPKNYVNLKKGDNLKIKGTVKTEESNINLTVFMGSETAPFAYVALEPTDNPSIYDFEYTIPYEKEGKEIFSQTDSQEYSVTVTASGEAKSSSYLTVSYDVDGPIITKDREQPVVQVEQANGMILNCINGIFTVNGIITDDYDVFGSATYKVVQKINNEEIVKIEETSIPSKFNIVVNTHNLEDEKPAVIVITAKDRSGNETEERYEYYVDQKTDKPVISNSADNINLDAEDYSDIANPYNDETNDYYNMFQRKSNLYINIDDDDGLVHTVTVDLQKYVINNDVAVPVEGNEGKVAQAVEHSRDVIQYTLPDEEGIYKAVVKAYDTNYDFTNPDESESNNNFNQKTFFLKVTGNGPDVTLQPEKEFISTLKSDAELKITFTVADVGNGPYKINIDNGDGQGYKPLFNGNTKTSPFDVTLNYTQGTTSAPTVKFIVKDKNNVGTEKTFTPKFDNEEPTIDAFTDGGYPKTPERTEDVTFYFKGSLNDNEAQDKVVSGVEKAYIRYVTGEFSSAQAALDAALAQTNPAASTEWIQATTNGKTWNYEATWASAELSTVFNTEGQKTVIVKAVDGAGNEAMMSKSFVYDRMVPEIIEVTGEEYTKDNKAVLTIKYSDTNPNGTDIKIVDILGHEPAASAYEANAEPIVTEEISSELDSENGKTTKTIKATVLFPKTKRTDENSTLISNNLEDGTYEIQIIAKDLNHRESNKYKFRITRDTQNPELDNIRLSTNSTKYKVYNPSDLKYFVNNLDGKFTIAGVANDNIGVKKVSLDIYRITQSIIDSSAEPAVDPTAKIQKEQTVQIWTFDDINLTDTSYWAQTTAEYKTIGAQATITVTDKAGNSFSKNLSITFDTTAPKAKHEPDAKGKDIYFNVSEKDNDDISSENLHGLTWDEVTEGGETYTGIDTSVGGKYGAGTYENSSTIRIRGKFEDFGSDVKMIYYKIYDRTEPLIYDSANREERHDLSSTELESLKQDVLNNKKYFAPLEKTEHKRVFYNVAKDDDAEDYDGTILGQKSDYAGKDYYKYWKIIENNFNTTISGFKEGSNYLVLVAEDNVGNTALNTAEIDFVTDETTNPPTTEKRIYSNTSMNVDSTGPSIELPEENEIIYTNGEELILTATVIDPSPAGIENACSGVDKVEFTTEIGGVTKTITGQKVNGQENKWSADVKSILPATGTATVRVIATDVAGTSSKIDFATVTIDKNPPSVPFNSPLSGTSVNKEITLTGTVNDGNGAGVKKSVAPKLYWTTVNTAAPQKLSEITATKASEGWVELSVAENKKAWDEDNLTWSFTIDTETLNPNGTDETDDIVQDRNTVYFTVSAYDKSGTGNIGFAEAHPLVIDQDGDRPVINITNLSFHDGDVFMEANKPVWLDISTVFGTVTDDDGTIQSLKAIAVSKTDTTAPENLNWNSAPNLYKNGTWTYNFSNNGEQKLYFRVVDKNNAVFISNSSSISKDSYGPRIIGSNDTEENPEQIGFVGSGNVSGISDDIVYVRVDTQSPILDELYYWTSSEVYNNTDTILDSFWKTYTDINRQTFGGTKKYLYIKYITTDTNGISSVTPTFNSQPVSSKIYSQKNDTSLTEVVYFDLSGLETGDAELTLQIKDTAAAHSGKDGIFKSFDTSVDNTAPEIRFSGSNAGDQVYGSSAVNLRGFNTDRLDITKVEYVLTKDQNSAPDDGWIEITNTSGSSYTSGKNWQIVFDGFSDKVDVSSYHAPLLKEKLFSLYEVAEEDQAQYDETQPVYIWIRATDELGNSGVNTQKFFLNVIPNGDRPAVDITYPVKDSSESDYPSVGGTVRITGTTDIQDNNAKVKKVYIQIDPSYNGTAFAADWKTKLTTLLESMPESQRPGYYNQIIQLSDTIEEGIHFNLGTDIGFAIEAKGSVSSWNFIINENDEFNSKINGDNRTIAIQAFAVSTTGKVAKSEICVCKVDPDAPVFDMDSLRFVQYSDTLPAQEIGSRKYSDSVQLKGQWYLEGKVTDPSGISSFAVNAENYVVNSIIQEAGYNKVFAQQENGVTNYTFKIPVGYSEDDSFGNLSYEIKVKDASSTTTPNNLKFNVLYDNKAPELTVDNLSQSQVNLMRQSNGKYAVTGEYKEEGNQSGFSRIAMFFTRERVEEGITNVYLVDPMVADDLPDPLGDGIIDGDDNFYKIGTRNGNTFTPDTNIVQMQGLYWRKVVITKLVNGNEITLSGKVDNVRKAGLCMVNNVPYLIDSISDEDTLIKLKGTLSDIPDTSSEDKRTVYFALAQIIDNPSQETGDLGLYTSNDTTTNADGDCMLEGVTDIGSGYKWYVHLDSSNILDGKVKMHFVAFDKAENYTEPLVYDMKVSNNAPRIAGVKFGADRDLDENVDDNEMITEYVGIYRNKENIYEQNKPYNGQDTEGHWITSYNPYEGKNKRLSVKGGIKVVPEIVGGNIKLAWNYSYLILQNGEEIEQQAVNPSYTTLSEEHSNDGSVRENLEMNLPLIKILKDRRSNGEQSIKFAIWDKTDGADFGDIEAGSEHADIIIPINIMIHDELAPSVKIDPFKWAGKSDNSIYKNNTANGHIELEEELPDTFVYTGASKGELDRDAKVSGKITFVGTATDNVSVQKLSVKISGYNDSDEFDIAWRDSSEITGWASTHYETEEYDSLTKETDPTDWSVKIISDTYNSESGENTVRFEFSFNTEKIENTAAANVGIEFKAYDKGSPSASGDDVVYPSNSIKNSTPGSLSTGRAANYATTGTLDADNKTGYYQVDVVPYITTVTTALSSLKKKNPSVYSRTALGHYPVSVTTFTNDSGVKETVYEKIKVTGFNITGGTLWFVSANENNSNASYLNEGYTIPVNAKSGEVCIKVNGVESLNNLNNKDGKGSYSYAGEIPATGSKDIYDNYYNRQPNDDNNNLLTDDVILDIWEFYSDAVKPISGNIEQPQMKINPVTGQIGFAFVNGPLYFSMPGKIDDTNYSYQYWCACLDFFTSVGLTYDKNGNAYAVEAGGDINTETADKFSLLTDRMGRAFDIPDNPTGQSSKDATNLIRMDLVGMKGTKTDQTDTTNYFEKQRFKSPSLATAVHGNNTSLYLAYYDAMTDEIRFKYGNIEELNQPVRSYGTAYSINAGQYQNWYYRWKRGELEEANTNNGSNYSLLRQLMLKNGGFNAGTKVEVQYNGQKLDEYEISETCKTEIVVANANTIVGNYAPKAQVAKFKGKTAAEMDVIVQNIINAVNPNATEQEILGIVETTNVTTDPETGDEITTTTYSVDTSNWTSGRNYKAEIEKIKLVPYTETISKSFGNFVDVETDKKPHIYKNDKVSLLAGGEKNNAGEYLSIGVISDQGDDVNDVVVAVWYDAKERVLKYSYNTTPTTNRAGNTNAEGWSDAITVFSDEQENAGEYCQLAVDGNGGIHIAAYDGPNCDVVYAYLPTYDSQPQTCVVDSSGVVGTNLTIDVAIENGKAIPRISYYSNSCVKPKLAYLVETGSNLSEGVEEDEFTGKWEVTVIPTSQTLNMQSSQYNKINVAVWKTAGGVLTNCLDSTTFSQTNVSANNSKEHILASFKSTSNGMVYGNGTSNAVLGYSVKKGSNSTIETAQMK